MRKFILTALALPLLATAACSEKIQPIGEPEFYRHHSGAMVKVSYTSEAAEVIFNRNAKNLIAAVVVDELADIGFARSNAIRFDSARRSPKAPSCKVIVTFDELLKLKNSVSCLKDGQTMKSTGAVFRFVELMVDEPKGA